MTESFEVRRIAVGEWQALREVRLSALENEPAAFCATRAAEGLVTEPIWEERCRMGAESPRSATFVVSQGGRFYGMTVIVREEEQAEVYAVFLEPAARGQGLARQMLLKALEFAQGLTVHLEVNQSLTAAEALYRAVGFQLDGSSREFEDGRVMRGWVRR